MPKSKKKSEGMELLPNREWLAPPDSPNHLTNAYIQEIGIKYMEKVKKIEQKNFIVKFFSDYINQTAAQKLENYNNQTQPYKKWKFLAEIYKDLKYHDEKLAISIRTLFESVFQCKILIKVKCADNHSADLPMKYVSDSLIGYSSRYFLEQDMAHNNVLDKSTQTMDSSPSNQDVPSIVYS